MPNSGKEFVSNSVTEVNMYSQTSTTADDMHYTSAYSLAAGGQQGARLRANYRINELPGCCGAAVVYDVTFVMWDDTTRRYTGVDIWYDHADAAARDTLQRAKHQFYKAFQDWFLFRYAGNAAVIIATDKYHMNPAPIMSLWEMCTHLKWCRGYYCLNPNTNNAIVMFTYYIQSNADSLEQLAHICDNKGVPINVFDSQ